LRGSMNPVFIFGGIHDFLDSKPPPDPYATYRPHLSLTDSSNYIYKTGHSFSISNNSGVGVFFSRQDAGLLPAKPDSGNCLAFYCRPFKTFNRTRTDIVFCLSRRQ
jgi:hypothetical protein